ncbi:C4-dicarboxylate TRAP transporter large permease protein DctM [Siminovitchia terrae]|uniref:C4-dicarboxylate TRAP transporter large permease protein DctM n=1 Tax=Siminovitchia terrae TaxID=1914933 RepID=A0ABQ4KY60_SIMTE|nr:TRAP transporter large permease [Siminovitchia terrae]GIN92352.1 C4-dicarboxylate TRAP transporter large permease protein DctM [Siminovitchia terrae]GIN96612.1 C4-dicarboxylate TRAP transporter large permease protein DctM [Siminovitchia terrae]
MLLIGLIIFFILLIVGAPIWLSLGLSGGILMFVFLDLPLEAIISQFLIATDKWILLAIPYFLLAGNLMTYMGTANKMIGFVNHLIGHLPGGMPAAAVITATIFGALSGSATATVVAVGSMMIPQMIQLGYSKENSMGVVASAGTLGQMIPPSIYMIIYASMVQIDVAQLFLAGIVPGLVIAALLIVTAIIVSVKDKTERKKRSSAQEIFKSFIVALPSLLMPVIVLGGIYSGVFTPTEAAAVSVVYVLIISFLFNRKEFTKKNIQKSLVNSMVTTTVIYLLLGGANMFSTALTYAHVPQQITEYVSQLTLPGWLIMLLILVLFLVFGMFLDAVPILYITIPILYPAVMALGYDPIHFGILTIACMMISQITPPVGLSLFVVSGHFKEKLSVVIRGSMPYLGALLVATIILLYVPWLSTFLTK